MFKKKFIAILTAAVFCMGLTGCGKNEIPDMTDEQTKAVGEYVAITMMKYDANHRSRLVDLSKFPEKPAATPAPSPEPSGEPSGMGPVDNTPVIDSAGNNSQSIEEVLGLPEGMRLAYSGQEICDFYQESEIPLSLPAAAGNKLLVLKYMLVNTGDQDREIDILSGDASFRITVNGKYARNALKSGLPSDLSTFSGRIQGNSSVEAVLLIEVDEEMASNINSISLKVKNGEKTYTVQIL